MKKLKWIGSKSCWRQDFLHLIISLHVWCGCASLRICQNCHQSLIAENLPKIATSLWLSVDAAHYFHKQASVTSKISKSIYTNQHPISRVSTISPPREMTKEQAPSTPQTTMSLNNVYGSSNGRIMNIRTNQGEQVVRVFQRFEMQSRGTPHIHRVICIRGDENECELEPVD